MTISSNQGKTTGLKLIERLNLQPHVEGHECYFKETFRDTLRISDSHCASTMIYFLLNTMGAVSYLHLLPYAEQWHFYNGNPVAIYEFDPIDYSKKVTVLGVNEYQYVVRPNVFFGAKILEGPCDFSLVGCSVAPGFEWTDLEIPTRIELIQIFGHDQDIVQLTRSFP